MNCTNYRDFEEKYKNYQWWIDKKDRIKQTIEDFSDLDRNAKAEAQTKVRISFLVCSICPV